jgi:hypothetical protein
MGTSFRGAFVISWSQTETDGVAAPDSALIAVGATWRWAGQAVRIDAPGGPLRLEGAAGGAELRARAARVVRRLAGAAAAPQVGEAPDPSGCEGTADPDDWFLLTDGRASFEAVLVDVPGAVARLALFSDGLPPAGRDLWVVRSTLGRGTGPRTAARGGIICFTPGTLIATPAGPRPVETLRPGDRVETRDSGAQDILWTGARRMTGARLYAMPHLRPIRIRAAAFGIARPDRDLIVSPQHRMLVRSRAAQALFNTAEVLIAAEDLVNDTSVTVDLGLREVTYHHLLLPAHEIIVANGLETESFHPAGAALDALDPAQRAGLLALLPGVAEDPGSYGPHARRPLSGFEAAVLRHEAA